VDNKYFDMFSTALLTSSMDVSMAAIGQGLFGTQQQVQTAGASGGGTTVVQSPSATAMQQGIQNLGQVGQSIIANTLNVAPTITVDQGTPINIFVNKDLVFPPSVTQQRRFIE
jgi:type IV secretion system protein VirB10